MEPYRTDITFQYLPPGAVRPDAITLFDVHTEMPPNAQVPAVGDVVTLPIARPRSAGEERGNFASFKVVGRHFYYGHVITPEEEGFPSIAGIGPIVINTIFVIVTDPEGGEVGLDIRE